MVPKYKSLFKVSLLTVGIALSLTACSRDFNSNTQEITILTPGADGAICILERDGYRRRIWTPTTLRINKSYDPLVVNCKAPGNRDKKIIVEAEGHRLLPKPVDQEILLGAAVGFPDTVVVDFTDIPPRSMDLPDYQKLLNQSPGLASFEEFRPGVPALQSDRYSTASKLKPRQSQAELYSSQGISELRTSDDAVFMEENAGDKVEAPAVESGNDAAESGDGFVGGTNVIGTTEETSTGPDGSEFIAEDPSQGVSSGPDGPVNMAPPPSPAPEPSLTIDSIPAQDAPSVETAPPVPASAPVAPAAVQSPIEPAVVPTASEASPASSGFGDPSEGGDADADAAPATDAP